MLRDFSYMQNLKNRETNKQNGNRLIDTGNCWLSEKGGVEANKIGEGGQEAQASSYKISHGEAAQSIGNVVNNIVITLHNKKRELDLWRESFCGVCKY